MTGEIFFLLSLCLQLQSFDSNHLWPIPLPAHYLLKRTIHQNYYPTLKLLWLLHVNHQCESASRRKISLHHGLIHIYNRKATAHRLVLANSEQLSVFTGSWYWVRTLPLTLLQHHVYLPCRWSIVINCPFIHFNRNKIPFLVLLNQC